MSRSKFTWFAALGGLLILVVAAVAVNGPSPAIAGDGGCCASKGATAVMNTGAGDSAARAVADKPQCSYTKAASAEVACAKGPANVSAEMKAAAAGFAKANDAFSKAVDSGKDSATVRALAVKAGGAYAEMARTAADEYRSSPRLASDGSSSFASWSKASLMAACPTGAGACGMSGAAAVKSVQSDKCQMGCPLKNGGAAAVLVTMNGETKTYCCGKCASKDLETRTASIR